MGPSFPEYSHTQNRVFWNGSTMEVVWEWESHYCPKNKISLPLTVSQVFLLWAAAASSKVAVKQKPQAVPAKHVTMEEFYQRPYCNTSTRDMYNCVGKP